MQRRGIMSKTKKYKKYRTSHVGALEIRNLKKGKEFCAVGHKSKSGIKTSATHSITILGYRADYLCNLCTKEWIEIWKECTL